MSPSEHNLTLTDEITKSATNLAQMKSIALDNPHYRHPSHEWLYIFTDESLISQQKGAGTGATNKFLSLINL